MELFGWIVDPPEAEISITSCEECDYELFEGDTVYCPKFDSTTYCSIECFIKGESEEKVIEK